MANDGEITISNDGSVFINDGGVDVCEDCCGPDECPADCGAVCDDSYTATYSGFAGACCAPCNQAITLNRVVMPGGSSWEGSTFVGDCWITSGDINCGSSPATSDTFDHAHDQVMVTNNAGCGGDQFNNFDLSASTVNAGTGDANCCPPGTYALVMGTNGHVCEGQSPVMVVS